MFLKYCWWLVDTKLSFFCCFSWYFRGVEDSGENCVRSILWSFLCAWCVVRQRLFKLRVWTQRLPEFDMPWMSSLLQWIFLNLGLGASMEASSKLQKRQTSAQPLKFECVLSVCKGISEETWKALSLRPYWSTFFVPLFSCDGGSRVTIHDDGSHKSSFHQHVWRFDIFSRGVYTAVFRVSIASHSFAQRQHTCGHSVNLTQLVFPVWSGTLIVLSVCWSFLPLLTEMTGSHKRTPHVVEEDFYIFLGIFGHIQKKRVLFGETPKKEGLRVHVIRTLSLMRKNKKFHILGPCQHEGPIWWKMLSFRLKKVHFWSNVVNERWPWCAQVAFQADLRSDTADARPVTIQNVKNTWSSLSSSSPLPPFPFPFSSFLSSWTPKTLQFLGKNAKIVMLMTIFDPTRGSYSSGRVLLRRNTL